MVVNKNIKTIKMYSLICPGGFCPGEVCLGRILSRGVYPGGFCPDTRLEATELRLLLQGIG